MGGSDSGAGAVMPLEGVQLLERGAQSDHAVKGTVPDRLPSVDELPRTLRHRLLAALRPPPPILHHLFALGLIAGLLTCGIAIGISIDTSGGVEKLGRTATPEACELPLQTRRAPTCAQCTCCSNVATSYRSDFSCPACVECCAHCPRCRELSAEHADCVDSGGKVTDFKGEGRGWYCVPKSYTATNGRLPEWFNSVLDYNRQWRLCAPQDLPTCEGLECMPESTNASFALPAVTSAMTPPSQPLQTAPTIQVRSRPSPSSHAKPSPLPSAAPALRADGELHAWSNMNSS
ncbi:hypothetical protein T492DRAFT_1027662 [Pavlovales sp. CCMP2436]|nr:hypothetical protein T492DRAFT_1027662 [Pavlovales sp. CCMP2436]